MASRMVSRCIYVCGLVLFQGQAPLRRRKGMIVTVIWCRAVQISTIVLQFSFGQFAQARTDVIYASC